MDMNSSQFFSVVDSVETNMFALKVCVYVCVKERARQSESSKFLSYWLVLLLKCNIHREKYPSHSSINDHKMNTSL